MTEPHSSDEVQRLREQLAELTRRVYRLEGLLADRPAEANPDATAEKSFTTASPPQHETISASPEFPSPAPPRTSPPPLSTVAPAATRMPAARAANTSLESRIGGQWLNRVGIIAVLVGLSYFLKLAFENDWIGPATQVLIGIAAGVAILLWSERFRRKGYPGFAYSLKALAIGALYLSLWAAAQYYHLVPPMVAFIGMVMVTLTSAALSLRQDAELLAAFALVGGFLTPVLISTGENHEIALFCYIALLDLGTAWIVAIRNWRRLLAGSLVGTVLLFYAWSFTYYNQQQLGPTLAFATFFFLLFAASPFLGNAPLRDGNRVTLVCVVLLNAAAYFTACYSMLWTVDRLELVVLMLAAAVVHFVFMRLLRRREQDGVPLFGPVYLAIAVGFITAAIPLKLGDYWITLSWLVEAAALFWAGHRSRSLLLRWLGVACLLLGITRLIAMDSLSTQATLLLNPRFGMYMTGIGALAVLAYFAGKEGGEENRQWAAAAVLALNLLALLALHFEIMDYFQPQAGQILSVAEKLSLRIARAFTYSAAWMIYGSGLMIVGFWKRSAFLRWQAIVLLALTAAKVFFYDIAALERGYRIAAFIVLGAILLAVSFFYQRSRLKVLD